LKFRDCVISGVAGSGLFDREAVSECLLTIPFFTAGRVRSSYGDGLTKAAESSALFSIGTSNFSACCGVDDFSDSRNNFGAVFQTGAFG
jgi:hypothetical protein